MLCQSAETSKPFKLKGIVASKPQLQFICLSEATWRQLRFSAPSNPWNILWLMVSIWGSHILGLLSDWTKLLRPNYVDGVWPGTKLTTLWGWIFILESIYLEFWKQDLFLIKWNGCFTNNGRTWHLAKFSIFYRKRQNTKFRTLKLDQDVKWKSSSAQMKSVL